MDMRQNISSGVRKDLFWKFRIKIERTSAVIFLWGTTEKKTEKRINYRIEEWHTSTPYNIFRNQYTYSTVCLLLEMWHWTNHCIIVCGKCIFDSNLKVALPLTQDSLNYTCRDNDTDEINFVGVLHAIISVPPEFVQSRLNMK